MNGWRGMFAKFRLANMPFFALRTPLTGCGFALAFGWLWFPVLRDVLLSRLIAGGPIFNPSAFSFALGAGCVLYGLFCRRLENSDARHRYSNVILAHGIPPLLLVLLLLTRSLGLSFSILDGALLGFAGAFPGVWWTTRLMTFGPGKAVASLAWAAFVSLVFSLPLFQIQPDSTTAVYVLSVSLALAYLAALFLVRENEDNEEKDTRPETAELLQALFRIGPFRGMYAIFLCSVVPIFFCIGSLSILVHDTDEVMQAIAQLCALIVATLILDGPVKRTLGISACVLAVMAFCLSLSSELAPMLYPVGAGLLEAAGVALCAAFLSRNTFGQRSAAFESGLFLIVTLVAVNGGQLVGWGLTSFSSNAWPVLPGLVAALLLGSAAYQGCKSKAETEEAQDWMAQVLAFVHTASDRIELTAATDSMPIIEQLTKRERAIATLLVNGYATKDAAKSLGMAEGTLRWHIKNLHKKTGAANRTELVTLLKKVSAISG